MTGARALCGGIAGANLNVLHALVELAQEKGAGLTVFSFLEKGSDRPDFLPPWVEFRAFGGNRFLLSVNLLRAAVGRPLFGFDHVTLAIPILPLAVVRIVRTVVFAHGREAWMHARRTSRWIFRCATLCLTNSHFTLGKMRERISKFRGEACPLGLSPEFPLNKEIAEAPAGTIELNAADGETRILKDRVLLLVGRMDPREAQKGHRALISILPELLSEFPDVQLVFPGPGDDRTNLRELAQRGGVASSVFLPGFASVETLQCLYRKCYAFVMPSTQEGFGLAYLEAMNYGKPCVGCFDQGAADVIVHGETGFLIRDANDSGEILGVVRALLSDPKRAGALGKAGLERLHERFTSDHVRARIKEQISRLL
jgi:glycosyltransferase involved in cell wall biosynthesis